MDKIKCKCGKASMIYELIDEDLFSAIVKNTIIVKDEYGRVCICKSCRTEYDHYDPCMVRIIERR